MRTILPPFAKGGPGRDFLLCNILFAFTLAFTLPACAKPISPLPFPQVEVGAHTDRPTGLAYDSKKAQLISASDDRTIRFWDASKGRLLRTARVPMSFNKEGELYALAAAPKKRLLATGGWTGHEWDRTLSVYLFDLDSMEMLGRLGGFPERISALDFSPDEKRLAVSLLDGHLQLFSVPDFEFLAANVNCKNTSYRIHFGANNRLVTNCFDGVVRLYDDNLNLLQSATPLPGKQPSSVHMSPDGKQILVSYYDVQKALLLDAESLSVNRSLQIGESPDDPIAQAVWSQDGHFIYAAGDVKRAGRNQILRWPASGKGTPDFLPASGKRIFRLIPVPNGGVAYSSLEQAVGILNADGLVAFYNAPPIIDHLDRDAYLMISPDASVVSFALDDEGRRFGRFFVMNYKLQDKLQVSTSPGPNMLKPRHEAPGMVLRDWRDSDHPSYNGKPLKLAKYQQSHALAISPKGDFFALGLGSELRRYKKSGKLAWSKFTFAGVHMVNVSADGTVIVAGLQDGSIRWYRADDGEEFFAMFPHKNEQDWVAWTPPGFFISSPNGDKYIGWQLNNGIDQVADFYSAWQFERLLYRPDIVADYFRSRGRWKQSNANQDFRSDKMRKSAPPDVRLSQLKSSKPGYARIRIDATKRQRPMQQYAVYVNDLPVTPWQERQINSKEQDAFTREVEVPLLTAANTLRVEVLTDSSFQVATTYIDTSKVSKTPKGDLYILAIGVNHLQNIPGKSLAYAAQDAVGFIEAMRKEKKLYRKVHTRVLSDLDGKKPTRENILDALSFLRRSGPDDTAILFIASHGISNKRGDYFMVPADATSDDVYGVVEGKSNTAPSLVKWDDFFDRGIRNAAGRRLLVVDTCQAQKIHGNFDFLSLAKRSAAAEFGLLAASAGDEESQEYSPKQHGLFTWALLDGMSGEADTNGDKLVSLEEAYEFTRSFVDKNRILKNSPQTPQLIAPPVLKQTELSRAGK